MTDPKIDAYLRTLRRRLRGFSPDDANDIIEELRSHIVDKLEGGAGVDDVLTRLGSADELASRYVADAVLARAEVSRTPIGVLDALFRWATLSLGGLLVLIMTIAGYFAGAALLLSAIIEPFHPQTAGLWTYPDAAGTAISLRLGFGVPPPGAVDVTGWWIVPSGLILGTVIISLTTRYALWFVRRARVMPR